MRVRWLGVLAALVLVMAGAAVSVRLLSREGASDTGPSTGPRASSTANPSAAPGVGPAYDASLDPALSTPLEDSYYPEQGDPGVDSLHYGLDLTWDPDGRVLTGIADITLRATRDAEDLQLDLLSALTVSAVTIDGKDVSFFRASDYLIIEEPVQRDQRLEVRVAYAGTPGPVPAPTTRSDFSTTGLTITPTGEIWTMQEPFGAFTWYPVNDQPSDKALYDFTIRAPREWVGVANGVLRSRKVRGGHTVTRWHLSHPAASYLTTVAVGNFVETKDTSASGVPISYWTHRGQRGVLRSLRVTPSVLTWNEKHLGPYPFDSLGIVVVDSESGMETQTMITLGDSDYDLSAPVIEHELTHQWYGDLVTPTDWSDLWMNEGMTMFIQGAYEAEQEGVSIDSKMDSWAATEQQSREVSGPPGAYDAGEFGEGNVYYGPALMWNELRHRMGNAKFWKMVRRWPTVHADGNATRDQYFAWLEKQTGLELSSFLQDWILGTTTPAR
jgi:aminopeptidase N